jgi:hypothetical protein
MRTRIRPIPFLEQPARVMERIQRVETLGWGFPKDKAKDIQKRIHPNPFLGQPKRVMERA